MSHDSNWELKFERLHRLREHIYLFLAQDMMMRTKVRFRDIKKKQQDNILTGI